MTSVAGSSAVGSIAQALWAEAREAVLRWDSRGRRFHVEVDRGTLAGGAAAFERVHDRRQIDARTTDATRASPGPDPHPEVAGAPLQPRPHGRPQRPGGSTSPARWSGRSSSPGTSSLALPPPEDACDIHCVTPLEPVRQRFSTACRCERSSSGRGRAPRAALRPGARRAGLHHQPPARRSRPSGEPPRHSPRRRAADAGARRTGPAAGAAPLLLEERQVGDRVRVAGGGLARILGGERLPHARRSWAEERYGRPDPVGCGGGRGGRRQRCLHSPTRLFRASYWPHGCPGRSHRLRPRRTRASLIFCGPRPAGRAKSRPR